MNLIVNPRSHESKSKQTKAATRIEPKTSAALPIIRCTLSTELSRSRGNLANNGICKLMLITQFSPNFEFRKRKLRSCNLSHCQ